MRVLLAALLIVIFSSWADAQNSIREVDFKNFTYPLSGPTLGHDHLEWLTPSKAGHLRLINGKDTAESPSFTLQSVAFADVTGDGAEDAVVVIHLDTGGTQQTDYIYIYSLDAGKPKILGYCHSGDRGSSGLYKVYGERGELVFELFDPAKRQGDCCSSGFVRTRYRWRSGRFERSGPREFITLQEP
jgi:hypothetical protein